jgi:hypothetical protein
VEGSLFESLIAIMIYTPADVPTSVPNPAAAAIQLADNTFAAGESLRLLLNYQRKQSLKITARRNIFDNDHLIMLMGPIGKKGDKAADAPRPESIRNYLRSFIEWEDDTNLYRRGSKYLVTTLAMKSPIHSAQVEEPNGWSRFWDQDSTRSIEGAIRFRERLKSTTTSSLRLDRVDDATGPVPNRLGADPERVGPR